MKKSSPFGYFEASGLGTQIHDEHRDRDHPDERTFYALLAMIDSGRPLVWGVARIVDIAPYSYSSAFHFLDKHLRLWKLAEYDYYVNAFTLNLSEEFKSEERDSREIFVFKLGPAVRLQAKTPVSDVIRGASLEPLQAWGLSTEYIDINAIANLRSKEPDAFNPRIAEQSFGSHGHCPRRGSAGVTGGYSRGHERDFGGIPASRGSAECSGECGFSTPSRCLDAGAEAAREEAKEPAHSGDPVSHVR